MTRSCRTVLLPVVFLVAGGCSLLAWRLWGASPPQRLPAPRKEAFNGDLQTLAPEEVNEAELYSNILPGDYVGPSTCGSCHAKQLNKWSRHPHRFMNQLPTPKSVKGDFSGHVWTREDGTRVTFSTEAEKYLMTVEQPGVPRRRYKVTRTVGSRRFQQYIGLQIEGPELGGSPSSTVEHPLPFGYFFRTRRWLPWDYLVAKGPDKLKNGLPQLGGIDESNFTSYQGMCLKCHNTYPYAYRLALRPFCGFPSAAVRAAFEPLSAALAPTIPVQPTLASFQGLQFRVNPDKHLTTLGISCESCHFGGRAHARDRERIRFLPTSRYVRLDALEEKQPITGSRRNPATTLGICAQCHTANAYGEYPNGASLTNSREAMDLVSGACASRISCIDCHEPHTAGPPSAGPALKAHLDACLRCHPQYRDSGKAAAHARHTTAAGVSCLDCHMPRYTHGLAEVIRTHRIAAPVEKSMVATAMPNACNLCHLDRSVRWTLRELERGWGRRLEPGPEWAAHYGGSLDRAVGEVWLASPEQTTRLVAVQSYAHSPQGKAKLREVVRALNDPVPVNRSFAVIGVERLLGRRLSPEEVNITASPAIRARQIEALLRRVDQGQ